MQQKHWWALATDTCVDDYAVDFDIVARESAEHWCDLPEVKLYAQQRHSG